MTAFHTVNNGVHTFNGPLLRIFATLLRSYCNARDHNESGIRPDRKALAFALEDLTKQHMPSGSGIDNGTKIFLDTCRPNRLVFGFGFHHMNENGYYDGWTEHTAVYTPTWDGFDLRITGRDRNRIKEHLYDTFHYKMFLVTEFEAEIAR